MNNSIGPRAEASMAYAEKSKNFLIYQLSFKMND